jgi:cell division protein FtsX
VKGILDSTNVVRYYAPFPRKSVAFLILGQANRNSVVLAVELDRSVVARLQQLIAAVGSTATVKAFVPNGRSAYDDVEIFMNLKACNAQIVAVRRAVERDPDIESFRFLTKADAFEEFKRLFKDQPSLIEHTTASELPVSFQLRVRDGMSPSAVASRYAPFAGVKGTLDRANPFAADTPSIPQNNDRSACARTP